MLGQAFMTAIKRLKIFFERLIRPFLSFMTNIERLMTGFKRLMWPLGQNFFEGKEIQKYLFKIHFKVNHISRISFKITRKF
jgi:hypothetical protein